MPLGRRPIARTMARTAVVAGTATVVSGRVSRRQQNRYAQQDQAAAYQAQPPPAQYAEPEYAPPRLSPEDENLVQLRKVAELHDQGILTDEEYTAKKSQLLGLGVNL